MRCFSPVSWRASEFYPTGLGIQAPKETLATQGEGSQITGDALAPGAAGARIGQIGFEFGFGGHQAMDGQGHHGSAIEAQPGDGGEDHEDHLTDEQSRGGGAELPRERSMKFNKTTSMARVARRVRHSTRIRRLPTRSFSGRMN